MKTAYYIAICDDGAPPHNRDKCVFAKRGTEPFENLAKGDVINANRNSCDVECLKQWWIGDGERIGWMTFTCRTTDKFTGENWMLYHACGNGQGLHMSANKKLPKACGWRHNEVQDMPSIWIQIPKTKLGMHGYV